MKKKYFFSFFMWFVLCLGTAMAQSGATEHHVTKGESILDIAKKYNVTPYDILKANNDKISSLNDIKEGDILIIPKSKIIVENVPSASEAVKSSIPNTITHTVVKGETKYGLSKKYGITIEQLVSANPHIEKSLNIGHVLTIVPGRGYETTVTTAPQAKSPENTFVTPKDQPSHNTKQEKNTENTVATQKEQPIRNTTHEKQEPKAPTPATYTVKYGDTKYSLSKKYGLTIKELEKANPHIVKMLVAGHVINIPQSNGTSTIIESKKATEKPAATTVPEKKPVITEPEKTAATTVPEKKPVITEPEKTAVTTVPEKKPVITEPEKTAVTTVPEKKPVITEPEKTVVTTVPEKEPETPKKTVKNIPVERTYGFADLTTSLVTSKPKKVLFISPFEESEFTPVGDFKNLPWQSDKFKMSSYGFYSGAMLAIDSLKQLGLKVTFDRLKIDAENQASATLPKTDDLVGYDAIFIPFYENIDTKLARTIAEKNTPVLTTGAIDHHSNSNNLYAAVPSVNLMRKKMLDYMVSKNGNIIIINDINRTESHDFITKYTPTAKFVEIKPNGTFNENSLKANLSKEKLNYIVLNSDRKGAFLNVTNTLLSELKNYKLQLTVLDPTLIPAPDDVSAKRFVILKMLLPSYSFPEMSMDLFEKNNLDFFTFSTTDAAMFGFDITFDTLLRLAQPSGFVNSTNSDITEHTKLKFEYKKNEMGGYSNQGIHILYYDSGQNLKAAD